MSSLAFVIVVTEHRVRRSPPTPSCAPLRPVRRSAQEAHKRGEAMNTLYLLYDERCALCKQLKEWLLVQRSWIGLSMIPAGSPRARAMFPALDRIAGANDL